MVNFGRASTAVDSTSKLTSFGLKLKRLFGLDQALRAVTRVETPGAEALLGQLEGIGYRATGRSKIAALAESNPGQAAALSRLINGARADEARGLVYAFERMTARGYTLVDNDFRYGGGRNHGIDMVFRSPNGGFAVLEAKHGGGVSKKSFKIDTNDLQQGGFAWIESRLERYAQSPGANRGLADEILSARADGKLESYGAIYRGGKGQQGRLVQFDFDRMISDKTKDYWNVP